MTISLRLSIPPLPSDSCSSGMLVTMYISHYPPKAFPSFVLESTVHHQEPLAVCTFFVGLQAVAIVWLMFVNWGRSWAHGWRKGIQLRYSKIHTKGAARNSIEYSGLLIALCKLSEHMHIDSWVCILSKYPISTSVQIILHHSYAAKTTRTAMAQDQQTAGVLEAMPRFSIDSRSTSKPWLPALRSISKQIHHRKSPYI